MAALSFVHPVWLWLIAPASALAIAEFIRRRGLRSLPSAACRLAILAALASAAAEPRWAGHRREATVVFLVDRSGSIGDDALAAAWARAGELRAGLGAETRAAAIAFDGTAELAIAPGEPWRVPAATRGSARGATDLAAAIQLALGLLPPEAGGHLVLLGDGRATTGELAAATAAATARGVAISVVPSTTAATGDPAIAAVALDGARIHPGATLAGHVEVDAGGTKGPARVRVLVGGALAATIPVTLDGGRTKVPFTYALPATVAPGAISVDAELLIDDPRAPRAPGDPALRRGTSRVVVGPPPHVVIVDGDVRGSDALAAALRAEQMTVTVVAAATGTLPPLAGVDLVILANAPAQAAGVPSLLDDALGERLVHWVNDGGGLLVLGGPAALDGNYGANRLADALPVELEPMTPQLDSSATVIVILDQSGSMGELVGGKTKLALAAEGASAVIRLLRSFDRVGVMAVQERVQWLVPLRTIGGDTAALEARVRRVEVGGGGIFVYTSLVAAQQALAGSTSPLRHVIVFSDTYDAAEQVKGVEYGSTTGWPYAIPNSFSVARALRASGTTVSVIGVGEGDDGGFRAATYLDDDDDSDFLRQLAAEGGGRYYRTTDANRLRALFVQDARRLLDNHAHDEDIQVKSAARHAALDGVDLATAPKLHGYQDVKPRPAAQVVVADAADHPILTRWPYGLGEVAVWASDAGPRWAADWIKWPGYARFWTQLVRSALRRREGSTSAIEAAVTGDTATLRVVQRGERAGTAAPRVRFDDGRDLPLRVVEPGVYEATVALPASGEPAVSLLDEAGQLVERRTLVRPPSSELAHRGPDLEALTALATTTGGTVSPAAVPDAGRDVPDSAPLRAWLVLAALLLLPLDAQLRRTARAR